MEMAPAVGLRYGDERRHGERRHRQTLADRRRGDRRRRRIRTLILAGVTTFFAHNHTGLGTKAGVSVSMSDFEPISPRKAYDKFIEEAAAAYRLDPVLIRSVMQTESAFNPFVVSPVGAQGLMQLMPELATEMGVSNAFDPRDNIMGGARYLRQLLDMHSGNVSLALASYNAGPGNVAKYHNRVPPFRETQRYVKAITGLIAAEHAAQSAGD
jgi:hypothetical protein